MRIAYDVDTQHDFMNKDGALYVPGAEEIKGNLSKLTEYMKQNNVPVFGSIDRHFGGSEYGGPSEYAEQYKYREGELQRYGGPFPDHCMEGTTGQWKIGQTTLFFAPSAHSSDGYSFAKYIENPLFYDIENPREQIPKIVLDRWEELGYLEESLQEIETKDFSGYDYLIEEISEEIKQIKQGERQRGIYFEKQTYDVFSNPLTEIILKAIDTKQAIIYGVATDYCVKAAVLGMQKRGIQCYVVEDAIKGVDVNPGDSEKALEEMVSAGAKLVTTQQVLEDKL